MNRAARSPELGGGRRFRKAGAFLRPAASFDKRHLSESTVPPAVLPSLSKNN
jgi:hypothetical protein